MEIQIQDKQDSKSEVQVGDMFTFKYVNGVFMRVSDRQYVRLSGHNHVSDVIYTAANNLDMYHVSKVVQVGTWKVERV